MSDMLTQSTPADRSFELPPPVRRVISVDALRGLVMFAMIFVNDLAGADHVPAWMKHFHGPNGMTFVDLVFPAFLFIVGLSIPLAMASRPGRGGNWTAIGHILVRTLALLAIGIMMVNSDLQPPLGPDSAKMGWSATWWTTLTYLSAILSFCSIAPGGKRAAAEKRILWRRVTVALRLLGIGLMIFLALSYRSGNGKHLLQLRPFFIRHSWYGILGVIGWAYLVASVAYFIFRNRRTALLGCVALVMCLYPAGNMGTFDGLWIAHHMNLSALGSRAAISVAGVLLGSILVTPDTAAHQSRIRFTLLYIAGFAAAAVLLHRQWGISKEAGTPSWCFWACAITAAIWLGFYLISDVLGWSPVVKPLAIAGRNVLLAYLLSEMMESAFDLLHINNWYQHLAEPNLTHAIARSAGCGVVILALTAVINRVGFRVKL